VLTNSEGGIHAINYQLQAENKFRGMVLTGAPGRSIGQLSREQIYNQVKNLPGAEKIMESYDEAITSFLNGDPVVPDEALPDGLKQLLSSLITPANLPFSRELWNYTLSDYISKMTEPILIVIGKKDIQVDWKTDGQELEENSTENQNITFRYPENANHVLKFEEKERDELNAAAVSAGYNASDKILDPETVEIISNWFSNQMHLLNMN
jgi:hypothetical protein